MSTPAPYLHPLWAHLHHEHGLILVESELHDVVAAVDESRAAEPLLFIERRPLLVDASLTQRAGKPAILISDELPADQVAVALWHEVVHLLRTAGGVSQAEEDVEAWARRLASCCPDITQWAGIGPSESSPGR